ncbi:MAG: VWA domain-containing protein [Candidatus Lokiarchaeota archaeon]|nr:VWA domain-containing protein [Candidatus Lokiarchaeota archaeon]
MKIYPYNPSEFSAEFISKMRKHPDIIQMPSPRQLQSIPQLLLARYLRKGNSLSLKDYVEIATATSFPDNQDLAKKIAFQILFPNCSIREFDALIDDPNISGDFNYESQIHSEEESMSIQVQKLHDEIEFSNSFDFTKVQNVEDFVEWLLKNQNQTLFKSALLFYTEISNFYKEKITTKADLMHVAKKKVIEKINSLTPKELVAIKELGFNDLVEKYSIKKWERITIKVLSNRNLDKDFEIIKKEGTFEDLINTIKYLNEINDVFLKERPILKNILYERIKTIEHFFNAAIELNEISNVNLNEILKCSLDSLPLPLIFKLVKLLDQSLGMNIRKSLYTILSKEFSEIDLFKLKLDGDYSLLELISKYAINSSSWTSTFQKVLLLEIEKAKKAFRSHEDFKILTNIIVQLTNSCENIFCAQFISKFLNQLIYLTIESCIVPTELKDVVEFLGELKLYPKKQTIQMIGEKIGMSKEEIAELIDPPYEILKLYMNKPHSDLKKIQDLIDKLKFELDFEKILELMTLALGMNNREGLSALGHFNLKKSLEAANTVEGKNGMDRLISTLTAGDGENLIKQWFLHRDEIPTFLKTKIKDLTKSMLIDLGINYSKSYLGSLTPGLFQTNLVRPYEIGDTYEDIDLEETMLNLLEKGKIIEHITYDDLFVSISSSGKRSVCIEMDISESMTGEKLAYMAICVTMLVYGMRKDELGITLFEKNTHILKEINQKIDLEKLADELLGLKSRGTTFVEKALLWARDQFKKSFNSKSKVNILFTDSDIYDLPDAAEILRAFKSLGVDFILVCPEKQYNIRESEKIVKLAGGQILPIKDWERFPELITNIINSRF